jgi:hypothetical protein
MEATKTRRDTAENGRLMSIGVLENRAWFCGCGASQQCNKAAKGERVTWSVVHCFRVEAPIGCKSVFSYPYVEHAIHKLGKHGHQD